MMAAYLDKCERFDPEREGLVRVLERDDRDVDGKLLKCGSKVLCHPSEPEAFREDDPGNRQEFLRLDRTWTAAARQRVWFPPIFALSAELLNRVDRSRSTKNAFLAAIDENLVSARGHPIPEVKSLPLWFALLAWEPRIKRISRVADLTSSLATRLVECSGIPREVRWPEEWRQRLSDLSELKVYALRGMTATVHVVAAFSTCVRFKVACGPEILAPGQEVVDLVRDIYLEWSRSDTHNQAAFTFFTIGSASRWSEQVVGCAAGDHWVVVSSQNPDGTTWDTRTPPYFAHRLSLRNFLDRLKPETRDERISKTKHYVDKLLNEAYEGNIRLDKVAEATGYRRSVVRDALFALQGSGHYHLYKTSQGEVAVGRKGPKLGTMLTAADFHPGWLSRMAFLSPAVTVCVWFARDAILGRPSHWLAMLACFPVAFAGEWLNTRFRKWQGNKE
jgi:hypothetical protein